MTTSTTSHVTETLTVCMLEELPEGAMRLVEVDDGRLAEGEFDSATCTVECPRHGSLFDLRSGRPKTLPAYVPVETFEARVEDGDVKLEVD